MTDQAPMLLQNPDGPVLTACPCGEPVLLGAYVLALAEQDGPRAVLCGRCSRQAAPELAACCEGLCAIAVTAPGLSPAYALSVVGAMVQQIAALYGPTLALMGVPQTLIERINNP